MMKPRPLGQFTLEVEVGDVVHRCRLAGDSATDVAAALGELPGMSADVRSQLVARFGATGSVSGPLNVDGAVIRVERCDDLTQVPAVGGRPVPGQSFVERT